MNSQRSILLATSNPHKIEEITTVLAPLGFQVMSLSALDVHVDEPVEDAPTFEGNAKTKAVFYARATGQLCLADDSGLEVEALDGQPGVHSARYAGTGQTRAQRDAANNAKLLDAMREVPIEKRDARFVCVMCLADPDGNVIATTRGEFAGLITDEPRGTNGFGYDPLLYLPDVECTSAQLTPQQKNARSHRGRAARAMADQLERLSDTRTKTS